MKNKNEKIYINNKIKMKIKNSSYKSLLSIDFIRIKQKNKEKNVYRKNNKI